LREISKDKKEKIKMATRYFVALIAVAIVSSAMAREVPYDEAASQIGNYIKILKV
jgi:hypothetical protein